jgi:tRNA threonylcarbamoyladenosine biosynthesis protein TsaE
MEKILFSRTVNTPSALKPLAISFVAKLEPGAVILLEGALGAGKTTFVKAVCNELGVDPDEVKSPSYTLINEYEGKWTVYHMDLYRLSDSSEINGLGISEYIEFPENESVSFIEWPQSALAYLNETVEKLYLVKIEVINGKKGRKVVISSLK